MNTAKISVILFIVLIAKISLVSSSSFQTTNRMMEVIPQNCEEKCRSCPPVPETCPFGVSRITGPCGCCKQCARQVGEECDAENRCDPHRNLYCSYADFDTQEGRCVVTPGRACFSNGKTYANGEVFQLGCKHKCTCLDGVLGCTPLCPITIMAKAPKNCLHPRLVTKPKQCCQEWICSSDSPLIIPGERIIVAQDELDITSNTISVQPPSNFMAKIPRRYASVSRPKKPRFRVRPGDKCKIQSTPWSPCSATCGMGVSERVTNDNKHCRLTKETRLCQLKPCDDPFSSLTVEKGKRCSRTVKVNQRLTYQGCKTNTIPFKQCGKCEQGKCCTPKQTKTKLFKFKCPNGDTIKKHVMIVKKCHCSVKRCETSANSIFYGHEMHNDTE